MGNADCSFKRPTIIKLLLNKLSGKEQQRTNINVIDSKQEMNSLEYVKGLDGIRGIAVLSVIFGHFGVLEFAVAGCYSVNVFSFSADI